MARLPWHGGRLSGPSWGALTTSTDTFPLPTVINKATSPSLQDPNRKITSCCSTLSHHVWALWAHRWGGHSTLCWLSPCWSLVGCAAMELTPCAVLPPFLPTKKWNPLAHFPPCAWRWLSPESWWHSSWGSWGVPQSLGDVRGCRAPHKLCHIPALLSLSLSWATPRWGLLSCSVALREHHIWGTEPRERTDGSWFNTSVTHDCVCFFGRKLPWASDGSVFSPACAGLSKDRAGGQFPATLSELGRWFRGERGGQQMTIKRASGRWAWTSCGINRQSSKVQAEVGYTARESPLKLDGKTHRAQSLLWRSSYTCGPL